MSDRIDVAFKEWAAIVRLMEEGRQALILRKGGIAEDGGDFAVEHRRFLFFPTFVHQQDDGLIPEGLRVLQDVRAASPWPAAVRVASFGEVAEAFVVQDEGALARLRPFHFWSDAVVEERYRRWREHRVHALVVRTFRLAQAVEIPLTPAHGGCRSWVELPDVATTGAKPALDDAAFKALVRQIRAACGG